MTTFSQKQYDALRACLDSCKDSQLSEVCELARIELECRVNKATIDLRSAERELENTRSRLEKTTELLNRWPPK